MTALSPRQQQIVRLRCDDELTRGEIALRLGISLETVKNHITAIMSRTRAHSMNRVCTMYGRATRPPEPVDPVDAMRAEAV